MAALSSNDPDTEGAMTLDPVGSAKEVVASHERFAAAADLDGVMSNSADDIVVLIPDAPLVKGKQAFREFYTTLLALGRWEFGHDYEGAVATGDVVVLHGVARGTLTPAGGEPAAFANNFLLVLKNQPDGKFRLWRISFAPSAAKQN